MVSTVSVDYEKLTISQKMDCLRQYVENNVDFVDDDHAGDFLHDWHCSGFEVFIGSQEEFEHWLEEPDTKFLELDEEDIKNIFVFPDKEALFDFIENDTDFKEGVFLGYYNIPEEEEEKEKDEKDILANELLRMAIKEMMDQEFEELKKEFPKHDALDEYFKKNCPKYYKLIHGEEAC